jgi:hypothetical protein
MPIKFLGAVWRALTTFFHHWEEARALKKQKQQAIDEAARQARDRAREKHDADVRSASPGERDKRIDRWMRD